MRWSVRELTVPNCTEQGVERRPKAVSDIYRKFVGEAKEIAVSDR